MQAMGNDRIAAKNHAKKDSGSSKSTTSDNITDITQTPDVAVWAKAVVSGRTDRVQEPSKIQSITTKSAADGEFVDPASKKDVAGIANKDGSLTDEADISKKGDN